MPLKKTKQENQDMPKKTDEFIRLPLMPLRDILVFPTTVVPLFAGRSKSIKALEDAMATDKQVMLVAQKNSKLSDPQPSDLHLVGTICKILQFLRLPDGNVKVLVEGGARAKVVDFLDEG
jgi:ATP-dependent Lon protease